MSDKNSREHWGSKIGFILAAAGSAIGLGNIWKFPYLAGENGGGAFVVLYLICIVVLGLPVMIAEIVIGRHTGRDPVGAFKQIGGGRWKLVGYLGVASGFFIMTYYSVVGGWTIGYIVKSAGGFIGSMTDIRAAEETFTRFIQNPFETVFYLFLFMAITVFIVMRGIKDGIEKWNKFLLPLLFIILIILIIRSLTLEGASAGLAFYLKPDFSKVDVKTVIEAMGQCFFSLSLGMGAMITYGSYLNKEDKILSSSLQIVTLDTFAAILSGLAIFPALFAVGMTPDKGPGLTFNILPVVFSKMSYGSVFAVLFFILLFIAALTSSISLVEVVVAFITDEKGWSRRKAVLVFGSLIFLLGIPSALSFSTLKDVRIFFGTTYFDFMDRLTTIYMLPIGGLFIALCLGWKYGLKNAIHELDADTRLAALKKMWAFSIRYISPLILVAIILYFGVYRMLFPH
ncbi:MAG: sodium-dependent transporter [Spirochaetota bacterium]|jgi:NSS family neurotransmitter:Na+ symporter|nr:sodium-dependent transporter [Spirochaetota bacterium]HPI14722.1 sodium-dependent transporter [Spirochaetota bacterium]